jgi:SAM-dependent methyltransferase
LLISKLKRIRRLKPNMGICPVCSAGRGGEPTRTMFVEIDTWLRDNYICIRCLSIPRERALLTVLKDVRPQWRGLRIHESSPMGRGASKVLAAQCRQYDSSQFFPEVASGALVNGVRSEDLGQMSLADASIDLLVTQDVMEHVIEPSAVFAEMMRVLRPGGAHIGTFPWHPWIGRTRARARADANGEVEHLLPAEYHASPVGGGRALVTTDWGYDLVDHVRAAGLTCEVRHVVQDRRHGLDGEFLEVFIFGRPAA